MLKKINSNYKKELTIEEVSLQADKFGRVKIIYVILVSILALCHVVMSFLEVYALDIRVSVSFGVGGLNFIFLLGFVITSFIYVRRLANLLPGELEKKFLFRL
jgi:hypothetical protein